MIRTAVATHILRKRIRSYIDVRTALHHVTCKAVATLQQRRIHISFYTIVTNYNGPLAVDMTRNDIATHIEITKYEVSCTLILTKAVYEAIVSFAGWLEDQ